MSANCNILYSHANIQRLITKVSNYFRNKNFEEFLSGLIAGDFSKETRFVFNTLDDNKEIEKSIKDLIQDLEIIKKQISPDFLPIFNELETQIYGKLHLELDETQKEQNGENPDDFKNVDEYKDQNKYELEKHFEDIYGLDQYNILRSIEQNFQDQVTESVFWDQNRGLLHDKTNQVLNSKIRDLKEFHFRRILDYLEESEVASIYENGEFIGIKYFEVLDRFYKKIKTDPDFKNRIRQDFVDRMSSKIRDKKTELYKQLTEYLMNKEVFREAIDKKFSKRRQESFKNKLFTTDGYSIYYKTLKDILSKNYKLFDNTVRGLMMQIEKNNSGELDAAESYTFLTHFDQLLELSFGESIGLANSSFKNKELGIVDKYQYKHDSSHQRKNYQKSENFDSTEYLSSMTKAMLGQIRLYNYKTDEFLNKRLDATQLVVATRNLIDSFLYNKASFKSDNPAFTQLVYDLHKNPTNRLLKILDFLFGEKNLVEDFLSMGSISGFDLNVLYSLYHSVYDRNNSGSLYSIEVNNTRKGNSLSHQLLQEFSGYVDRNTAVSYLETEYDMETGEVKLQVKRKFFNTKEAYFTANTVNTHINEMSQDKRTKLQEKYQLQELSTGTSRKLYQVVIGDQEIKLSVPNGNILIYSNKHPMHFEGVAELLNTMKDIDLMSFLNALEGNRLNTEQKQLKDILQFIQDYTNIGLLRDPKEKIQALYNYKHSHNNFLEELLTLAIRNAYINSKYLEAGDENLMTYLRENDTLFKTYLNTKSNAKYFDVMFNEVRYVSAHQFDEVIQHWSDSLINLTPKASKATTKDNQGNSLPNNSVNKLGTLIHYEVNKQKDNSTTSNLFFVKNTRLIASTLHDLEVTSWNQESKSVKDFSQGELFYSSIFNKFWGHFVKTGNVIIQPTEYSDKTTLINYEVITKLGETDFMDLKSSDIIKYHMETVGRMYKQVWEKSQNKLQKIVNVYNAEHPEQTPLTIKEFLNSIDEFELSKRAQALGLEISKDLDYRKVVKYTYDETTNSYKKTKGLDVNELLDYYANYLYNSEENLSDFLIKNKAVFLQNLLDAKSNFQIIEFKDNIDNYLGESLPQEIKTKNAILRTILKLYSNKEERQQFFENWVDRKTGKLILAKQGGMNILNKLNKYDSNVEVELNPLLNKFYYLEGFYSNNLRFNLTGNELNHPDKAFDTMYKILRDYNINKEGITKVWEDLGITDITDAKSIIHILKTTTLDDLINYSGQNQLINDAIKTIYQESLRLISNTAQGTQFKRNVIIPATLQHCSSSQFNSPPALTKCAVIMDEEAPVYNYNGGHESNIDSQDGHARITAWQSIMENDSLGSQAVGFVKKPIWHSYNADEGSAFLAKFATSALTNEMMIESQLNHSDLFRLFKKMSNIRWFNKVKLSKTLFETLSGAGEHFKWFRETALGSTITERKRLLYQTLEGDTKEILYLAPANMKDGSIIYYTKEADYTKDRAIDDESNSVKVYHVFYDVIEDGKVVERSKHATFNTHQEATEFISNTPGAHTIDSLFELYEALGGLDCCDVKGNSSEFVHRVVVNYMNNIGDKRYQARKGNVVKQFNSSEEADTFIKEHSDFKKEPIDIGARVDQETYYQPLKHYHIGYALNNTAVKNGAKNVNPESSWYDEEELTYFEEQTDGLGMQMNADHDIINSELTEFSQVIAASSAYGYTFDNCEEIYQSLSRSAFESSKDALVAVENFIQATDNKQKAFSDLYDAVGRIILTNQQIKNKESLEHIIMQAVTEVFYNSTDHTKDDYKLPFSDANVYSNFIATLASVINKESIKRKHPGSGCVMVPAYNTMQYFEINGVKYLFSDLIKKARNDMKVDPEAYTGVTTKKQLVQAYLTKYQNLVKPTHRSWFMPSDNVDILNADGTYVDTVELDSLDKYYRFTDGLIESELVNNTIIESDYSKGEHVISLKERNSKELSLTLQPETLNGMYTKKYIISVKGDATEEELLRLFQSAIDSAPSNSIIKLSEGSEQYMALFNDLINRMPEILGVYTKVDSEEIIDVETAEVQYRKIGKTTPLFTYRENVTRPRNLRPSIIRWRYEDGTYDNIFNHEAIKNPYISPINKVNRKKVQDILHELHTGKYKEKQIYDLENEPAELIMSNMYAETFGIENESLSEVLEKGKEFFEVKINTPKNLKYDVAFIKSNGQNTLISIGRIDSNTIENPFDPRNIITQGNEIFYSKKGKKVFKIGVWKNVTDTSIQYKDGNFVRGSELLDQSKYRLEDPTDPTSVQEKVEFVKRHLITDKIIKKGKVSYKTTTIFQIADDNVFKYAFEDSSEENKLKNDIAKQRSKIISDIYTSDKYFMAQVNPLKSYNDVGLNKIKSSLGYFKTNNDIDLSIRKLIELQLESIDTTDKGQAKEDVIKVRNQNKKAYDQLVNNFLEEQKERRYASFLRSLHVISSRIPAQTLQSFMAMKTIAWTKNSNNMAYVSHFQTFLQGSDYDIDKAYIMGSSFDDNGIYVGWSNLFDYSNGETLLASMSLPIPKNITITNDSLGADITSQLDMLLETTDKVQYLKDLAKVIKSIEKAGGNIKYDAEKHKDIIDIIQKHEYYQPPIDIAESAYKNGASANIYAVSHDIRNRDQAYTAITMKDLRRGANKSPKGNQVAKLNMLNPLTKYVMQHSALVGKQVIGIAANGEKFWFNAFYHWHKTLSQGDKEAIQRLKFSHTFSRIRGRSIKNIQENTIIRIPDLDGRDAIIKQHLMAEFGDTEMTAEQYTYVDQWISQLLSAATDNAKELILGRINAGTNFAKMYLYGIIMGFDINDLISFMTSPVALFIDSFASPNMFQADSMFASGNFAVKIAKGEISASRFLHGSISSSYFGPDGEPRTATTSKSNYVLNQLENTDLGQQLLENENFAKTYGQLESNSKRLVKLMQAIIKETVINDEYDIRTMIDSSDMEINNYLDFCQSVVDEMKYAYKQYSSYDEFDADIQEFGKIFELASEISTISSKYLGLNQGIPTDEAGLLNRLHGMNELVYERERIFGIDKDKLFGTSEKINYSENRQKLIDKLKNNNPTLLDVEDRLVNAYEYDLINNFDIIKFLESDDYKKAAIDYYGLIMGTFNGLDMVTNNPIYQNILNQLRLVCVSKKALSSKSRLILKLTKGKQVTLDQISGIIKYVDKKRTLDFIQQLPKILLTKSTDKAFDRFFNLTTTNKFNLSTMEGIASFRYWMEHDFREMLLEQYDNPDSKLYQNPLIPRLTLLPDGHKKVLATDVTLLEPETTSISREKYQDILTGIARMEGIPADILHPTIIIDKETGKEKEYQYTYADLFQLYNLIVNNNQYGDERLTTIFKVNKSPDNIINQYFNYTSEIDQEYDQELSYERLDYQINAAPFISEYAEALHTEPFVKVKDSSRGYILKQYDPKNNRYEEYKKLLPVAEGEQSSEQFISRWKNFYLYCPYEMPIHSNKQHIHNSISFEGKFDELSDIQKAEIYNNIKGLIKSNSLSAKIFIFEQC